MAPWRDLTCRTLFTPFCIQAALTREPLGALLNPPGSQWCRVGRYWLTALPVCVSSAASPAALSLTPSLLLCGHLSLLCSPSLFHNCLLLNRLSPRNTNAHRDKHRLRALPLCACVLHCHLVAAVPHNCCTTRKTSQSGILIALLCQG